MFKLASLIAGLMVCSGTLPIFAGPGWAQQPSQMQMPTKPEVQADPVPGTQAQVPAPADSPAQMPSKQTDTPVAAPDKTPGAPEMGSSKVTTIEKSTRSAVSRVLTSDTAVTPAEPHKVQMRLSGSTCIACLHELQVKVGRMQGVAKVKIDFPADNMYEYYAMPSAATAAATIVYDASRTNLDSIKALLRTQGYHPFRVVDKRGF